MKLPSIQKLQQATRDVVYRFPLEIFCATLGTALMLWQIEKDNNDDEAVIRIILCAVLGLVLFLSTSVFAESKSLSKKHRAWLQVAVVLVLVACWFSIDPIENETSMIRYAFLLVAFHLLVSCAPSISIDGFWEYNKQLFIRILTAQLYSWVLFGGLCIAVATSDFLFNIDLDSKIYLRLYILIVGLFNTVFFLAGVPSDFKNLQQQYPKGLKIFTQYVLIPLATIYLCIILVYEGKVIVEWSLPKGIISWLILGYAVYGILSILLVYPVRLLAENKWISTYSRWFYFLLIPLLPLLCVSIGVRVMDYGITELRYVVLVLAMWLTGITLYFLFSKKHNIKIIPISLAVLALLSAWGPQSASSVSERSQVGRLVNMFKSQNNFKDGLFTPITKPLADSVGNETVNQLRFVNDHYGHASLKKWLPTIVQDSLLRADTIKNNYSKRYTSFEILRKAFGLESYYQNYQANNFQYYQAVADFDSLNIEKYAYLQSVSFRNEYNDSTVTLQGDTLTITNDKTSKLFDLSKILQTVESKQESEGPKYPNKRTINEMTTSSLSPTSENELIINLLYFQRDSTKRTITTLEGFVLIKK